MKHGKTAPKKTLYNRTMPTAWHYIHVRNNRFAVRQSNVILLSDNKICTSIIPTMYLNREIIETKICPYCGEEIMATAKKCRHCGKWLTTEQEHAKTTHPDTEFQSQTNIVEKRQELPNAGMLQLACWITIVFEGISGMQNYPIELFSFLSPIFEFIADNIPDWVVTIALGTLWIILIMGVRTSCQIYNIGKIPFIGLVCLMVGVYFMDLIICFVEDEDIAALLAFFIALPLVIALSILEFIMGIKLHHHKAMQHIGLWFMIYSIVPIIAIIVELGLWGEETQFMVTFFIEYAITFALLVEMANVFGELKW